MKQAQAKTGSLYEHCFALDERVMTNPSAGRISPLNIILMGPDPRKQKHTSKRVFERLRDEHGFTGGITIVKDYIFAAKQRQRDMFVPLVHPSGHAQADFGEALAVIGGVERKIHFLVMELPHSDACFLKAYPAEKIEISSLYSINTMT